MGNSGSGTLNIEAGGAVSNQAAVISLNSGATGTATVTGVGSIWTNSSNLSVGNSGSGTLNIQNSGLVSVGDSLIIVAGAGSSGTVNLSGGTLQLNGGSIIAGAGTSEFNFTGGTLANVSSIGFDLNQQGGTLAPGNSPGSMSILGSYTQNIGAILEIELAGLGGIGGTDFDFVDITGAASLLGSLDVLSFGGFSPLAGSSFDVLTATSIDTTGLQLTGLAGFDFNVISGGNGQILQLVSVIPEPATLSLLALGGIALLPRRWRDRPGPVL